MDSYHILAGTAYVCWAIAAFVFTAKLTKYLRKSKHDLQEIEEQLALTPDSSPASSTEKTELPATGNGEATRTTAGRS